MAERPLPAEQSPGRIPQIDFFRGLALIIICLDHIEANWLARLTPRALGYADMAEAFVFLSGWVSAISFRRRAFSHGAWPAVWHFWKRAAWLALLYVLVGTVLVGLIDWLQVESMLGTHPVTGHWSKPLPLAHKIAMLRQGTGPLGILPMYIWCLASAPALWAISLDWSDRHRKCLLWGAAVGGYLAVQAGVLGGPKEIPGTLYYHPVAWQSLFLLGGLCGECQLPHRVQRGLTAVCLIVLGGLILLRETSLAMSYTLKPTLGPLRLLFFLASAWILSQWVTGAFLPHRTWIHRCGQHSLAVFIGGAVLSVLLSWWLLHLSRSWVDQLAVNVLGGCGCVGLAGLAERLSGKHIRFAQGEELR